MTKDQLDHIEFEQKCKNFLENYVPDLNKSFVAGGFFPRLYHNFPIRDIDVYACTEDSFKSFAQEYKRMSNIEVLDEKEKFVRFKNKDTNIGIDLIGFHIPNNVGFVKNFDFTICQGYYQNDHFQTYNTDTFKDIVLKRLRFTGFSFYVENENNILTRMKKYVDLGFEISKEDLNDIYHFLVSDKSKKFDLKKYSGFTNLWTRIKNSILSDNGY